jgi:hypothetical protein
MDDSAANVPVNPPVVPPQQSDGALDPTKLGQVVAGAGALSQQAGQARQAAMDRMRQANAEILKAIDDTTESLKAAHGSTFHRMSPMLMAMAGQMLHATPGVQSSFTGDLGNAFSAGAPYLQRMQMGDEEFWQKVAELKRQRGELAMAPEKLEAEYQGKMAGEAERILGQAGIAGARLDKPIPTPDGGTLVSDGKGGWNKYSPDGKLVGHYDAHGATATPSDQKPTQPDEGIDKVAFLQKNVDKRIGADIRPPEAGGQLNLDKLYELAKTDPAYAQDVFLISNYEKDPGDMRSTARGRYEVKQAMRDAQAIDPTYRPGEFGSMKKVRDDWKVGPDSNQLTQLSKTVQHMAEVKALMAALNSGNTQLANSIKNNLATATGDPRWAKLDIASTLASAEMVKYLAGATGGGQTEREELSKKFSGPLSPQQQQGAIDTVQRMMMDQAESLATRHQKAFGHRFKTTVESLMDAKGADALKQIRDNDISTPEGREAMMRARGYAPTESKPSDQRAPTYNPNTKKWE